MVGPEPPECFGFLDHEGRQHDADLVAVERGPIALGVARDGNRDADAIGVGIAGDDQVRPRASGLGDRRFERSGILRVGDVVGHVGEIAVGRALRCEDVDPAEARGCKHLRDRRLADAVQRRVDDRDVASMADRLAHDRGDVGASTSSSTQTIEPSARASANGFSGISRSEADATQAMMPAIVGGNDLSARSAVTLEAIVRRRIVRGGDHDAGVTVEVPDGKREQGGRARLFEKEDLETGRRQDPGAELGEFRGMMPRVVGDHARSARALALARSHIVGQSPRALGDRPLVEDIGADRVHLAAAAAGAKLEHGVKGIVKLVPPFVLDVFEQPAPVLGERGFGQPAANIRRCRRRNPSLGSGMPEPCERSAGVIIVQHFLASRDISCRVASHRSQANPIREASKANWAANGCSRMISRQLGARLSRAVRTTQLKTLAKVSSISPSRRLVKTSLL